MYLNNVEKALLIDPLFHTFSGEFTDSKKHGFGVYSKKLSSSINISGYGGYVLVELVSGTRERVSGLG